MLVFDQKTLYFTRTYTDLTDQRIVIFTGECSQEYPFGNTRMDISDQQLFEQNKEEIKEAYTQFKSDFENEVSAQKF